MGVTFVSNVFIEIVFNFIESPKTNSAGAFSDDFMQRRQMFLDDRQIFLSPLAGFGIGAIALLS